MKFRDAIPGLVVLAFRLALAPVRDWPKDWISVLATLWIAIVLTSPDSRHRRWSIAVACLWLAAIYGAHQGPWTFAAFR